VAQDTIAAVATGTAATAIGILRLSGPKAIWAVEQLFTPLSGKPFSAQPDRYLALGDLHDIQGRPLDQCMATLSHGPRSYTGEDTCELQCHGSPAVLAATLAALRTLGVRQALPGEFTKRAFLNGRLDLTQAEAVIDLIDARSMAVARNAAGQLSGALRRRIDGIYTDLVDVSAHFDAVLDYSDEDLEPFEIEEIRTVTQRCGAQLDALLSTVQRGQQLRSGIPCAIVGAPNAGKSSLLNALLGYDRAIVTDLPGTTRDTLQETLELGDLLLRLVDTAGLRDTQDKVEQLGVERSRQAAEQADLILLVVDGSTPLSADSRDTLSLAQEGQKVICVVNKSDLPFQVEWEELTARFSQVVSVSAATGEGLDQLSEVISALYPQGSQVENGELLTNLRQADGATQAREALRRVEEGLAAGMTPDGLLTDLEDATAALAQITGRSITEDVTDRIFERFCVGK
jgi:tRNA modification GTPase